MQNLYRMYPKEMRIVSILDFVYHFPTHLIIKMASFTTLVHIDVAAACKVAAFVGKLSGSATFEEESNVLINKQNTLALIDKVLEKQEFIFAIERDNGEH